MNSAFSLLSSRPRRPYFSLARTTMMRPSGVSSASDASCAALASSVFATPGQAMNSVAWRLPSVMVPVLSSSRMLTSPAASTARPTWRGRCAESGDPFRRCRWQRVNRRWSWGSGRREARRGRRRLRRSGVNGERLQRDDGEQEDDRQSGEQNVERDFVRRFLTLCTFDESDHAIEESFAGVGGDADVDLVGEDAGASGDGGAIASGFANDRRGLAGDGGFIDARRRLR